MSVSSLNDHEWRQAERGLLRAFGISVLAHAVLFVLLLLVLYLGWLKDSASRNWMTKAKPVTLAKKPPQKIPVPEPQEIPLNFVEVDPAAVMAEPPKNPKYYSSKNSQAANQQAERETNIPKLNGQQAHVARTETAPRSKPVPLQPAARPSVKSQDETQEVKAKPKGGEKIGDLAMAKPDERAPSDATENDNGIAEKATHARPRTLAEARALHPQSLPGEKMKQDGGVKRRLVIDAFDAKATPFGEYDRELIEAIQYRWDYLLEEKNYSHEETGKVVVEFVLDLNGHVSNVSVVESSVGQIMTVVCQMAIIDPSPYAAWPSDMRHALNTNHREIRFTFYYD